MPTKPLVFLDCSLTWIKGIANSFNITSFTRLVAKIHYFPGFPVQHEPCTIVGPYGTKCLGGSVQVDSGLVHSALLTNLCVFADIWQTFTLLCFCAKVQIKILVLCIHTAHSNGGKNTRFCGFYPSTELWSRQISVFVHSHLSTGFFKLPFMKISTLKGLFVDLRFCAV